MASVKHAIKEKPNVPVDSTKTRFLKSDVGQAKTAGKQVATIFELLENQENQNSKTRSEIENIIRTHYLWVVFPKDTKVRVGLNDVNLITKTFTLAGSESKSLYGQMLFSAEAVKEIDEGRPVALHIEHGKNVLRVYAGLWQDFRARVALPDSKTNQVQKAVSAEQVSALGPVKRSSPTVAIRPIQEEASRSVGPNSPEVQKEAVGEVVTPGKHNAAGFQVFKKLDPEIRAEIEREMRNRFIFVVFARDKKIKVGWNRVQLNPEGFTPAPFDSSMGLYEQVHFSEAAVKAIEAGRPVVLGIRGGRRLDRLYARVMMFYSESESKQASDLMVSFRKLQRRLALL